MCQAAGIMLGSLVLDQAAQSIARCPRPKYTIRRHALAEAPGSISLKAVLH